MSSQQKDNWPLPEMLCPTAARLSPAHGFCPVIGSQGLASARCLSLPSGPLKAPDDIVETLNLWFCHIDKMIGRQCAGTCLHLLNISCALRGRTSLVRRSFVSLANCSVVWLTRRLQRKDCFLASFKCCWNKLPKHLCHHVSFQYILYRKFLMFQEKI